MGPLLRGRWFWSRPATLRCKFPGPQPLMKPGAVFSWATLKRKYTIRSTRSRCLLPRPVSLADISSATVFLKDEKTLPLFLRIMEGQGLADLPMVICKADVCRDDLLFELDGVAGRNL